MVTDVAPLLMMFLRVAVTAAVRLPVLLLACQLAPLGGASVAVQLETVAFRAVGPLLGH